MARLGSSVRLLKVLAAVSQAGASALSALWTFPSILASAFLVAWGAEAAQFLISQGLALALLAWLQTLPEFAVEAVIAWEAGKDPERAHLAIANLTGAIRLLLGLGWPMIYFVFAVSGRKTAGERLPAIKLDKEHAVEVIGLIPPLLYFLVILAKRSFGWVDAVVLIALYVAYLLALMNLVSSNINQWTVLAAMIPLVYGYSHLQHFGAWSAFHFDAAQQLEILLTLLQTALAMLLLFKMEFDWLDATIIFVLWLGQFLRPSLREEVAVAYGLWMVILGVGYVTGGRPLLAPKYFWETIVGRSDG